MDSTETLNFEKIWAMFQETDRRFKETDRQFKETDRQFKETDRQFKETDRQFKETRKHMEETDRRMKRTDKMIGDLGNRFGELAEHLVAPSINEKFNELGFTFEQMSENISICNESKQHLAEIDILLENGDVVIAVEVKAKPVKADIDDHIKRIKVLRERADAKKDKRKFRGAIAGAIMRKEIRDYAHKTGFYVIEQTGDTVKISVPEGFTPREW